ncbi:MAG: hypothetical protein E7058_00230 [Lentisphaerae bacterium]|nr:hypothetical protein [Lentisphaerota bacterium]
MKRSLLFLAVAGIVSVYAAEVVPGTPRDRSNGVSSGYKSPGVNAELKVNISEGTNEVRFIQDNADPYVVTKAYRLKNADAYVARGYLRNMIEAKQVNASPVQVAAIKYSDGTAFLVVSAEEYRFSDSKNGEGIDSLVAKLDKRDLATVSNDTAFMYYPKYLPAATLKQMLEVVGSNTNDPQFAVSPDTMLVDAELNVLMVSAPVWSCTSIKEMLAKYDKPMPQVRIGYKVIEIYAENDDRIGVDFQSWKNNDGVDLFSAGARIRRNWSSFFHGGVDNNGHNRTSYWNFNPKWNTRYLDFLTSIGKAKVLTSGSLLAKNRETASITLNYGYFYERNDYSVDNGYGMGEFAYTDPNPNAIYRQQLAKILPETLLKENFYSDLSIAAFTPRMINYLDGVPIWKPNDLKDKDGNYSAAAQAMISKVQAQVTAEAKEKGLAEAMSLVMQGKLQPTGVEAYVTEFVTKYVTEYMAKFAEDVPNVLGTLFSWYSKGDTSVEGFPGIIHGKLQYPMAQDGFLFDLTVRPVVTGAAATVEFNGQTISLLGWNSDGSPRVSDSKIKTKFQAAYGNQEFVIGGLRRTETVRNVAGLPFLKDIPVLGLLFSTENESIKQSQLVIVATLEYVTPSESGINEATKGQIEKTIKNVNKGVDSKVGNMFFQQYGIDTDEIK